MAISPDTTKYQISSGPKPGLGSVGQYQSAGMPYITGSSILNNGMEHVIDFPTVTRSITVINRPSGSGEAPDIRVHFAATGSGHVVKNDHYILLTSPQVSSSNILISACFPDSACDPTDSYCLPDSACNNPTHI